MMIEVNKYTAESIRHYLSICFERYLQLFEKLVAINSHTTNSEGVNRCGMFIAEMFKPLGFIPEMIPSIKNEFGNHLILTCNNDARSTLAGVSHLDTVYSEHEERENNFSWRIDGERIFGPGVIDIKGGTIALYMLVDAVSSLYPDAFALLNWKLFFNASEEEYSDDFAEICTTRLESKNTAGCLVFEGGMCSERSHNIVVSRKGRALFTVTATGKTSHSGSNHEDGINAIVQIADAIGRISSLSNYAKERTFNIGNVSGGNAVNRIPDHATAVGEMRAFGMDEFEEGIKELLQLNGFSTVQNRNGARSATTVTIDRTVPCWPENTKTLSLFKYWEKAGRASGISVAKERRGGVSDGNYLWNLFPTIDGLGPCGGNSHCSLRDESIFSEPEYIVSASLIEKTVLNSLAVLLMINDEDSTI